MEQILFAISDMSVALFDLWLFTRLVPLKEDTLRQKAVMYGGCGLILTAYFVAAYCIKIPASIAMALLLTVPSLFLFLYLSKFRDSRLILTFCFLDTASLILAFFARWAIVGLEDWAGITCLVTLIALMLAVAILGAPFFEKYKRLLHVENAGWGSMAVSTVCIYIAMIFIAVYPKPLMERMEYAPVYFVFSVVVLACYWVFIQSVVKTQQIHDQNLSLKKEAEVYRLAYTDSLTGLLNRAAYIELLHNIQQEERNGEMCCLCFDLNELKWINDHMGHHEGDRALVTTAKVMEKWFRMKNAWVYRVGGDEFNALAPGLDAAAAEELIKNIRDDLQRKSEREAFQLSVSAGYAFWQGNPDSSLEQAFIQADRNMYQDKKLQKNFQRS